MTIVSAVPFAVVMVGLCVSLWKDLAGDPLVVRATYAKNAVEDAVVAGVTEHGDDFRIAVEHAPPAPPGTRAPTAPGSARATPDPPAARRSPPASYPDGAGGDLFVRIPRAT